jgi:hypothetical protein
MRVTLIAAVGLVLWSCNDKTPGGNDSCPAGEVRANGACHRICRFDSDCPATEICTDSICGAGARTDQPAIDSVDGDGTAVSGGEASQFVADNPGLGDLTGHHVDGGILVGGTNLLGVRFDLTGQNRTITLEPVEVTATTAHLTLPADVTTGEYVLTAANSVGTDQAGVYLLRGEQGPAGEDGADGSPDSPADVLAKILQVDGPGSGIDADTLDGQHASAFANADTVDGMHAQEIIDEAIDYRCVTVINDNSAGGSGSPKGFNLPFDCLSPYNGGQGCWGEMHTLQGSPLGSTVFTAHLRLMFVEAPSTSGVWYISGSRPDLAVTRRINADNQSIVNPVGDGGDCDLRTSTVGAKNTSGAGFNNLVLRAAAARWCYLRVCEPLLPPAARL